MSRAPIEFVEQRLIVRFPADTWQVLKWDDDPLFCERIAKLNGKLSSTSPDGKADQAYEGTKAVDFVALHPGQGLYLIEVKDFRGHGPANEHRHEDELPLEIGLKVRDTVAGLVGADRLGKADGRVAPFAAALIDRRIPLHVITWIAEDAPGRRDRGKRAARDLTRRTKLAGRLRWLTEKVWVDDPLALAVDLGGVSVTPVTPRP